METFGVRLKKARMSAGMNQKELGKKCVPEMDSTQISQYETQSRNPGYNQIVILKKALGCSFDDLMDEKVGAANEIN